jgi:hypothetical protein
MSVDPQGRFRVVTPADAEVIAWRAQMHVLAELRDERPAADRSGNAQPAKRGAAAVSPYPRG